MLWSIVNKTPFFMLLVCSVVSCVGISKKSKTPTPPQNITIYHGAYPNLGYLAEEGLEEKVLEFETLVGKNIAWVYMENSWVRGTDFPAEAVHKIISLGKIPFIRIMPQSNYDRNKGPDQRYNLHKFVSGQFDDLLRKWMRAAKKTESPLMVQFCVEVNGNWFPWNGIWYGGAEKAAYGDPNQFDGPEIYRDAYRRVIDISREEAADNITWVLHLSAYSKPDEDWNAMEEYYPGDDYIDWVGFSVYGAQTDGEQWYSFTELLDFAYERVKAVTTSKPLAVLEFGAIEDKTDPNRKTEWLKDAFTSLRRGRYPKIKAISYWQEHAEDSENWPNFRIDSSDAALSVYQENIKDSIFKDSLTDPKSL